MKKYMILPIVLVSACAWQTEVLNVGENRYQVSANASPARGGVTGARGMVLNKANKKCESEGKSVNVESVTTDRAWPSNGVATATFTCL